MAGPERISNIKDILLISDRAFREPISNTIIYENISTASVLMPHFTNMDVRPANKSENIAVANRVKRLVVRSFLM